MNAPLRAPALATGDIAAATPRASAIYEGTVRHRRYKPHAHAFGYRMFQLYLDLDELPTLFAGSSRFWSLEQRNWASFHRADYHGDPAQPLADAVRDTAERHLGRRPTGPIRLLAHARYFGYCFNPVVFFYCYADDGVTLDCIVAEITNTPWKERHAYVLPAASAVRHGDALHWSFDKCFHVSPFIGMQRRYDWRFTVPGDELRVHMNVDDTAGREFDATLVLRRSPLDEAGLNRCLRRFPWLTAKVIGAIHWQAFLIWLRRNPVYDHPAKSTQRS